ncbi:MAG: right-handed parallel beta-helix repeat-containing protein, partial [Candidatus Aenigmarchaeota archaeon]|nr:right-handed parallel beta-helix repeat-containing protein [Candidatus Aenigmarchaeota archaeon]
MPIKFFLIFFPAILAGFLTSGNVNGATIYVDNQMTGIGFDADGDCATYNITPRTCGSGNSLSFNTLQEAADFVVSGDMVYVRGGEYKETTRIRKNGTATNRITFKNYPGEKPVINGEKIRTCFWVGGTLASPGGDYVTLDGFECKNMKNTGSDIYGVLIHGPKDVTIKNFRIYNDNWTGHDWTMGIKISGPSDNILIEGNTIYYLKNALEMRHSTGDYPGKPNNIIIRGNHVHHAHIDCSGLSGTELQTCLNNGPNQARCLGGGANGVGYALVENNLAHHCDDFGIGENEKWGQTIFKDNIIYGAAYIPWAGGGNGIKSKPITDYSFCLPDCPLYQDVAVGNYVFLNKEAQGIHMIKYPGIYGSRVYNNLVVLNKEGLSIGLKENTILGNEHDAFVKNNLVVNNTSRDWTIGNFYQNIGSISNNYIGDWWFRGISEWQAKFPNTLTAQNGSIGFRNLSLLTTNLDSEGTPGILQPLGNPDAFFNAADAITYARNAVNEIFGIGAESPVVDAGVIVPGIHCSTPGSHPGQNCREWYGNAPDIGAFESPYTRILPPPTPTPTSTPTPTFTITPTPTFTVTPTPSSTITPTPTPSSSVTPTPTYTST